MSSRELVVGTALAAAAGLLLRSARRGVATAATRLANRPRSRWAQDELPALLHSPDYLFVYKMHDLHMDQSPRMETEEAVTLASQLTHCFPHLADPRTAWGFRHVHQLDYATSGVLLVALNKPAAKVASRQFAERKTRKLYLALVAGHAAWERASEARGVGEDATDARGFRMALEGAAGCSRPLPAHTDVFVVARGTLDGRPVTKLLLRPVSGRRHQLRVHCGALGHMVVGDVAYSGDEAADRMALHAWRLELRLGGRALCVGSADPFPCTGGGGGGADGALFELPPEGIETEAALRELRGGSSSPLEGVTFSLRAPPAIRVEGASSTAAAAGARPAA